MRRLLITLFLLALPVAAVASTVRLDRNLVVADPVPDNLYLVGTDVNVVVPLPGDVIAAGGTITLSAPVAGDAMLAGGTIDVAQPVAGDVRAAGARIIIENTVGGDLIVTGGTVTVSGTASSTRIAGGEIALTGGATGPVVIYGANVTLAGEYAGNVEVIASDKLTLGDGTHIIGELKYNAPQEATVPASALVEGGITYTGSSTYLPTAEEAQRFAIAGAGVFLIVKVIAAAIAAGLLSGLFPALTMQVADKALSRSPRRFILLTLLGFAVAVAAPVLMLILALSFVGMAVAVLLALLYLLLLMLGYLYAAILAGAALSRGLFKRPGVSWRAAILGVFALHLIGIVPGVGLAVTLVLAAAAMGSLMAIGYRFAFGRAAELDLS
ncbi:MAG TPA: hypothetical protein VFY28_00925 [Candidatus Paceibacterota bacterium]|nr:hypothetical protein [Candidatus Paceibacterota bacterium]